MNIKSLGQNLTCILIEKLISNCIIFETSKYIYRNGYAWLLTAKAIVDNLVEIVENLSFYEFPREKSETAIVHKNKT